MPTNESDKRLSQMYDNLRSFINLGNDVGVNSFGLIAPPDFSKQDIAIPQAYFGYFAYTQNPFAGPVGELISVGEPSVNIDEYQKRVLILKVPQEVQNLVPDDKNIRQEVEQILMKDLFPSFVLVFGKLEKTGEEIALLYSIVGISAGTALKEMQNGLIKGMAKLN